MMDESTFSMLRDIGRDLFLRGLISSHAGNASVRVGRTIHITRRGSMLGRLHETDMIAVDLEKTDAHVLMASSELAVHRAIYKSTSALAVIHAHPPYATLLSMVHDALIPIDSEGSYLFKRVPVITVEKTIGSEEAGRVIGEALRDYKIVMMRGHGSFARGDMPEEAYMFTSSLEASSFYLYHMREMKEYRKFSDKYKTW
jgi:L-fuculose-phosphate aldolase